MLDERAELASPILFVRHSKPAIVTSEPAATWALSQVGEQRARSLGDRLRSSAPGFAVVASDEVKAKQTAELLGFGPVTIDPALGEVAKPWFDDPGDHEAATAAFLRGVEQDNWELRSAATARFDAAVRHAIEQAGERQPVIVSHGTVLSLWLGTQLSDLDPVRFWLDLVMPDAWLIAPNENGEVMLRRV